MRSCSERFRQMSQPSRVGQPKPGLKVTILPWRSKGHLHGGCPHSAKNSGVGGGLRGDPRSPLKPRPREEATAFCRRSFDPQGQETRPFLVLGRDRQQQQAKAEPATTLQGVVFPRQANLGQESAETAYPTNTVAKTRTICLTVSCPR